MNSAAGAASAGPQAASWSAACGTKAGETPSVEVSATMYEYDAFEGMGRLQVRTLEVVTVVTKPCVRAEQRVQRSQEQCTCQDLCLARYSGSACQQKDWQMCHKMICKPLCNAMGKPCTKSSQKDVIPDLASPRTNVYHDANNEMRITSKGPIAVFEVTTKTCTELAIHWLDGYLFEMG